MKKLKSLERRLGWMLIAFVALVVVAGSALALFAVRGAAWLVEVRIAYGTLPVYAAIAAPAFALIVAAHWIRTAARFRAGLLMVVALRTAAHDASRRANGRACTAGELARVARLNLDEALRVLDWLAARTYQGSPIVHRHRRGLFVECTLAPGGEGWSMRILKLAGWSDGDPSTS